MNRNKMTKTKQPIQQRKKIIQRYLCWTSMRLSFGLHGDKKQAALASTDLFRSIYLFIGRSLGAEIKLRTQIQGTSMALRTRRAVKSKRTRGK